MPKRAKHKTIRTRPKFSHERKVTSKTKGRHKTIKIETGLEAANRAVKESDARVDRILKKADAAIKAGKKRRKTRFKAGGPRA